MELDAFHGQTAMDRMRAFLAVAPEFHLGDLPTEQPHPLTRNLSTLAADDPSQALRLLHAIDTRALDTLQGRLNGILLLAGRIKSTIDSGRRVFLTGCGSTGRLSLALESIWRREKAGTVLEGKVSAFMTGGDTALVRSIEGFEDHLEYGASQLAESGFREGDLLIASTEGGETPFVIGAALRAAELSANPPCFLYCNPGAILGRVAARSAAVLSDPRLLKLDFSVGPMALSGSTRMQASSVLMAAIGAALFGHSEPARISAEVGNLVSFWRNLDPGFLEDFILVESARYRAGGHILYLSDADLAITVLTDTTERSPTFSMVPFENSLEPGSRPSLCYLSVPGTRDWKAAWEAILGRPPRSLSWMHIGGQTAPEGLPGFDFSAAGRILRETRIPPGSQEVFTIARKAGVLELTLGECFRRPPIGDLSGLSIHLVLKMLLNAHSTLVMGRLGRYDGNLMTWVRPSNYKLVDRAIRYADLLLRKAGVYLPYDRIAEACFELQATLPEDLPLVRAMVEHLLESGRTGTQSPLDA